MHRLTFLCICAGLLLALFVAALRIGVEAQYSGNPASPRHFHPFIKESWSTQILFVNPAWIYLKLWPYIDLDDRRKVALVRFCGAVYGTSEPAICYRRMEPVYGKPVEEEGPR